MGLMIEQLFDRVQKADGPKRGRISLYVSQPVFSRFRQLCPTTTSASRLIEEMMRVFIEETESQNKEKDAG